MNYSEKNKKAYDKICDDWQAFRSKTKVNTCIAEFARHIKSGGKILDIGCGTGYPIDSFLSAKGFKVLGIDISPEMIKKAESLKLDNADFQEANILNFQSQEKFDGIIAFDSLWHISLDEQYGLYKKLSALMNDGAYLLFTHGNRLGEVAGDMYGETFYYSALDTKEVHTLLSEAGLTVVNTFENYKEKTTGDRDLLLIARK